jgi:hypothetical protein
MREYQWGGVMSKWRVDIFRKRLLQLGTVTAPVAQEALTQAYNLFRTTRKLGTE